MPSSPPLDNPTLDRNWSELLQELRVTQTGCQILTAFLLTVPFTDRFAEIDDVQRTTYLVVFSGSVLTTVLIVAPVAFHRVLFRQRRREWIVEAAHQCARAGLVLLALTSCGVLFLVFDLVLARTAAVAGLALALALFTTLWIALPLAGGARD